MYDPISKRNIARFVLKTIGFQSGGKQILDIGFGFGLITFMFDKTDSIAGIEIAQSAIDYATRRAAELGYHNARFLRYDGEGNIPLSDGTFDLIICSHVLEHVPDDHFLLKEMKRMLKPGGVVLLNVPVNEEHFPDPRHMRKYTERGFLDELQMEGFTPVFSFRGDRLWNTFGWFFEKDYHNKIPVVGFILSSVINVFFSSIPFSVENWLDQRLLKHLNPRQFATCAMK
jgi:ubiquinone/menaquinone biosynthesis C-methylase UbiE